MGDTKKTELKILGINGEETGINEEQWLKIDLTAKKRKFIAGLITGILLIIFIYIPIFIKFKSVLMLIVSTPVLLYVSYPIFNAAFRSLMKKSLNMDVMYSIGIGVAYIASLPGTAGISSKNFIFYETAVLLASFLTLGRYLETKAKGKTSETIKEHIEEAQGSRPPIQRITDRVVSYFIPVILLISILSFLFWFFVMDSSMHFAYSTLISILIIACPSALGLAAPTAVTVGIERGAELGILIKNGDALERSEKLTGVVFEKTGTLTTEKPQVTDIIPVEINEQILLSYTASVEKKSSHPLAEAIVNKAVEKNAKFHDIKIVEYVDGKGIIAKVNDRHIVIGSRALFKDRKISISKEIMNEMMSLESEGKTAVLIAIADEIKGIIGIQDILKKYSRDAVYEIQKMGLKTYMITGDNRRTAEAIASKAGIKNVLADVLPQDKALEVKRLQGEGEIIAFVGNGINDAPALAQSDVGIALGSGTDIAFGDSEIVLMKNMVLEVVSAIELSRKVMRRIKENIFFAFAYNTLLIPVAAGVLYPLFRAS